VEKKTIFIVLSYTGFFNGSKGNKKCWFANVNYLYAKCYGSGTLL